jgi:hypothetical protein
VNPIITAALIAGAISVASFGFNAWTTSRTLQAARVASLRDRQAGVYQQVLAYTAHKNEIRRNISRTVRYDPETEARLQGLLDEYSPPNWFELEGQVLAFCPDAVIQAFRAAKEADDAVWAARAAHAEAVELNRADPTAADPNGAVALQVQFRAHIQEAEKADSELIEIVRDKMLGTRPPDGNHSLIGKVKFSARSRTSLR